VTVPALRTERLLLEPFTEADLDDLHALNSEPLTMRFVGGVRTPAESAAELGRILAASVSHESQACGGWAIRLAADRTFVGRVGIKRAAETGEHELLYAVREAFRRRGLASEAAAAVVGRTFERDVAKVIACASPENEASIALMRKIGMTFERRARMYGEDVVVYAALRRGAGGSRSRRRSYVRSRS
jgi:[ribosomal protein S5]-alanine N-acetyltransferase